MTVELKYYGHACFGIEGGGATLLIDPFLTDNPQATISADEVEADYILVSHGHGDHLGDAVAIAQRTGATIVANFEICNYCEAQGCEVHPMHIGGGWDFPFGRVKMTPALHGGQVAGKGAGGYTTVPAGLLLTLDGCGIYHAGDTALTTDMTLLEGQVDVALLPIGDNFTMGPEDAARAVDMIKPRVVIPIHYDTWPLIGQDPESFRARVEPRAEVVVLKPGDVYEF